MTGELALQRDAIDLLYDGVYFLDRERRISYWSKGAEAITGYKASEMEGARCPDTLLAHIDKGGRRLCDTHCPGLKSLTSAKVEEAEVYVHHKAGHRIPVTVRAVPLAQEGGPPTNTVVIFSEVTLEAATRERIAELEKLALIDPLTSLANRRYAEVFFQTRLDELVRYGWTFGLIFIDVDQFKRINDAFGHDVGDKVLQMVGKTFARNSRSFDAACRWGGEEFLAFIVNVKTNGLYAVAERFRLLVGGSSFIEGGKEVRVAISTGATLAMPGDNEVSLLRRVDELMYQSKAKGGNCVTLG